MKLRNRFKRVSIKIGREMSTRGSTPITANDRQISSIDNHSLQLSNDTELNLKKEKNSDANILNQEIKHEHTQNLNTLVGSEKTSTHHHETCSKDIKVEVKQEDTIKFETILNEASGTVKQ